MIPDGDVRRGGPRSRAAQSDATHVLFTWLTDGGLKPRMPHWPSLWRLLDLNVQVAYATGRGAHHGLRWVDSVGCCVTGPAGETSVYAGGFEAHLGGFLIEAVT